MKVSNEADIEILDSDKANETRNEENLQRDNPIDTSRAFQQCYQEMGEFRAMGA